MRRRRPDTLDQAAARLTPLQATQPAEFGYLVRARGCAAVSEVHVGQELRLIVNVAAALGVALLGGLVAHWMRQSVIVGYLIAGIIIGPFTPGFVGDREQIAALAEVGVIFLMFALGIEFSLKQLSSIRNVAFVGTLTQVLLLIASGLVLGVLLGWPVGRALFLGGIISISSTMVILKALLDRGEVMTNHGRVLLGMLVVQDLTVVLLIVLLPRLASGDGISALALAGTLLRVLLFVGATLFLGARVVPRLMVTVERLGSPELFLLAAITLALGTAALSARLGLSPALGAFLSGLLLSDTEFDHRVISELVPMRDLFATLFFVSVGMLIDPAFITGNLTAVLALAAFILAAKVVATLVAVAPFRVGSRTAAFASLGMAQTGEFSYLLAREGATSGSIPESLYNLVLTSSVVTIMLTPAAFRLAPRLSQLLDSLPGPAGVWRRESTLTNPPSKLHGHAIIVGYGRVGKNVLEGLRDIGVPVVVIDEDLRRVRQLREAGTPALLGDASYPSVLSAARPQEARLIVIALPDPASTLAAVRNARQANAQRPILVRMPREADEQALRAAGATSLVAPERAGADLLLRESAQALSAAAAPADS